MHQFRARLTYANVTASLALFLALGGGAYAATQLPKNSVGTRQLKNGAVTKAKLAKGVSVQGAKGDTGPQGPAGAQGQPGAPGTNGTNGANGTNGTNGAPGLSGVEIVTGGATDTSGNTTAHDLTGSADCPSGKKVLGGGYGAINALLSFSTGPDVSVSKPLSGSPEKWSVTVRAGSNDDWGFQVFAVCANAS